MREVTLYMCEVAVFICCITLLSLFGLKSGSEQFLKCCVISAHYIWDLGLEKVLM